MSPFSQTKSRFYDWQLLDNIPDAVGFAGSFAGVSNGALIVAGGANFPNNGAPWLGSRKIWYDDIFVLKAPSGKWERVGRLPRPLGYGISITTKEGIIFIGGSNGEGHYADVYMLIYENGNIEVKKMPSLPLTLANGSGALVNGHVYVVGGLLNPDDQVTQKTLFSLDLENIDKGWKQLSDLPGPSRMLAVAAAVKNTFYVFSGTQLTDGKRNYLKDGYSYSDKEGWKRLKDMPYATVAAPSPTFSDTDAVYILGGDDGTMANSDLREKHPGFSTHILEFNLRKREWSIEGKIPIDQKEDAAENPNNSVWAPVTTTMAVWENKIVLPGGEVRPATRTPRVRAVTFRKK
ncbi:MAG: galactose oxidase [Niabella sp.]